MLYISPEHFDLKPAFAKIVCEPSWRWQKREKPMGNFDLFYVWSGKGEVILNDTPYEVGKGSCFLFRPGDHTSATHHPQKPLILTYIHFSLLAEPAQVPESYRVLQDTIDFETMLTRYVRLFLHETFGGREEAQLVLKQLMIHLLRVDLQDTVIQQKHSNQLMQVIREIANYIQLHPGKPHRIEDLAQRAGLSPRYFSLKFKEIIGQSVQSFIIRARIERAEHLLYYAGMNVTEVADALGYRDIFFFSRQFKQYTGKNPSDIR